MPVRRGPQATFGHFTKMLASAGVGSPSNRHRSMECSCAAGRVAQLGRVGELLWAGGDLRLRGAHLGPGVPVVREGGGLSRGATLARRPAGQSAQHPAHPFVIGRVRVSGVGVMVANRGAVHAE